MTLLNKQRTSGSTLVIALLTLLVLSLIGANVLRSVTNRYNSTTKNAGWQEALWAAESGADVALANCRWMTTNGTQQPWQAGYNNDGSYWGWLKKSGAYQVPVTNAADALNELRNNRSLTYILPTLTEAGEGTNAIWAKVTVDAPTAANTANPKGLVDANGNQWYRIRSVGYSGLTGMSRVGEDDVADMNARHTSALRKFSLRFDRFEAMFNNRLISLTQPQAQRAIEILAQPKTPFDAAVIGNSSVSAPGAAGVIDSYDSRDATKSTSGQYDSSKRQSHGDALSNTASFNIGGTVWGDVGTNGGNLTPNSSIMGTINNSSYTYLPPVLAPTWSAFTATPVNVNSNTTITIPSENNTAANPARYKLASISQTLTINPPSGSDGYTEIWVVGDITGAITVTRNAHVKIYFAGNISVKGRDIDNQNYGLPNGSGYLQFYGINPTAGTQTIDIASPGDYAACIYAPAAIYKMNGNPDVMGSVVVGSFQGNGNTSVHYDEALAGFGDPIDFRRASWVEDER